MPCRNCGQEHSPEAGCPLPGMKNTGVIPADVTPDRVVEEEKIDIPVSTQMVTITQTEYDELLACKAKIDKEKAYNREYMKGYRAKRSA